MRRLASALLPPLVLFVVVVVLWQLAVRLWNIPSYVLPAPWEVGTTLVRHASDLAAETAITGVGAVCGFLASLVLGTAVALVFSQSRWIRSSCYPYAIFLQTVPIVAIAPLVVIWFDYGFRSVVIIACIISLFPVIANVTTGLITIDPGLRDLFQLHRASRWQVMVKLQIPNAVPYLVTGARVSSGLAVVGAIVGEFFVGYGTSYHGLGFTILYAGPQMKTTQLVAATIASAMLGVALFAMISLAGRLVIGRWYDAPLN